MLQIFATLFFLAAGAAALTIILLELFEARQRIMPALLGGRPTSSTPSYKMRQIRVSLTPAPLRTARPLRAAA